MACAASTDPGPGQFDLDAPWQLAAQVRIRPEAFGALLYHFGTRQLSFLKSPALLAVVSSLGTQPSARAACAAAGVPATDMVQYARALATLAASRMICQREEA
jgi:putative mycofactocin binding protein MftB